MGFGVDRVPTYRVLGSHALSTIFNTSSTHTTFQDEGLTKTVTYAANRILRISFIGHPHAPGGAQTINIRFVRGASTVLASFQLPVANVLNVESTTFTKICFTSAGATEAFKVQICAQTSNTAVTSYGDANYARVLLIEDLGPQ